jgi:hypothetical protein
MVDLSQQASSTSISQNGPLLPAAAAAAGQSTTAEAFVGKPSCTVPIVDMQTTQPMPTADVPAHALPSCFEKARAH